MIFPRGRALHRNLDSLFVKIDSLISILETKLFTGYLNILSTGYEGVLVFYRGKPVAAFDKNKGVKNKGHVAKKQILRKGKEKDCSINVYAMPGKTLARLMSMKNLRLIYKDLSSDFADLDSLVEKLQYGGAYGCIDVTALNNQWTGIVFLSPEQIDASFLSYNDRTTTGATVLEDMRILLSRTGAVFNVFSTRNKIKPFERMVSENKPSQEQLVQVWGDIIGTVDKTVQPHIKKRGFTYTFKTVLKEISVVYPFLHPISGGFYYENGKASYRGSTTQLSEALGKSLSATVSRLAAESRKVNLTVLVKSALQSLIQQHEEVIKHFSLISFCELFDMTIYDRVVVAARPFFGENTDGFLERHWLNKLGATPANLKPEDLGALVAQLEKTALLLITKDEVKQLCQQIRFIRELY